MNAEIDKIVDALTLFNEKAEKLRNSNFIKAMLKESGVRIRGSAGKPIEIERYGPNEENIEAFVLTFRFFIQDNEDSSLRNLEKIFSSPSIPKEHGDKFKAIRASLNKYLDDPTMFRIKGKVLSRRGALDTAIYGGLAHANKEKKKEYDEWMTKWSIGPVMTNEIVSILAQTLKYILQIKRISEAVIIGLKRT